MLLSRVSPFADPTIQAFPELSDQLQYEWAELDTHDFADRLVQATLRSPRSIRMTTRVSRGGANIWVAARRQMEWRHAARKPR